MSLAGSGGAWAVDCPQNFYQLNTQAEVDAFPQGCDSVLGSLRVTNGDSTSLSALNNLTSVGGSLYIDRNTALTNVDGLSNITSVGGWLNINNNSALNDMDGLSSITSVGTNIAVYNNATLTTLDGLSNINSLGGHLAIYGNERLTNVDGLSKITSVEEYLYISENVDLTNLSGLSNITSVLGNLTIESNAALTTLDGLSKITDVGGALTIKANAALTTLDGLSSITNVSSLKIDGNNLLANLDALISITGAVEFLWVQDNNTLTNLDGLSSITSVVGNVHIGGAALTSIDGLINVKSVGGALMVGVYGEASDALSNLYGLSSLTSVGDSFLLYGMGGLTNTDGLSGITSVGELLSIFNNDALVTLEGLSSLTSVGGNMYITGNAALTNLNSLSSLTSVGGDLYIQNNPELTNCQALAPVIGWPSGPPNDSVGSFIQFYQNGGSDCNSVEAILASILGPSQPLVSAATGGNERISLIFSPSTTPDALFPITGYEAVCSGLTEIETVMGYSSPVSVGNLTNYREYDCTIAPVTNLGALPLSSPVSATPSPESQAPSAPQITNIESGTGQVSISASVDDEGGSPVTSYTAYCFGDTLSFGTSPTSPITVSGLTNGEAYECLVTATNDIGTSPLSAASASITPVAPPPGC